MSQNRLRKRAANYKYMAKWNDTKDKYGENI
jgi:hypothetical protein